MDQCTHKVRASYWKGIIRSCSQRPVGHTARIHLKKAMGKGNLKAVQSSIAYKALVRIGAVYDLEKTLRDLSPKERLWERQASVKPL